MSDDDQRLAKVCPKCGTASEKWIARGESSFWKGRVSVNLDEYTTERQNIHINSMQCPTCERGFLMQAWDEFDVEPVQ